MESIAGERDIWNTLLSGRNGMGWEACCSMLYV